jgi:hypothetical protein
MHYLLPDVDLEIARGDPVFVSEDVLYDESLAAETGRKPKHIDIYRVQGCSFHMVNGRYLPYGQCNGYNVYRNVRGWTIMHASLIEIPELGIFIESCYDIYKGPSLSTIMDNRASK